MSRPSCKHSHSWGSHLYDGVHVDSWHNYSNLDTIHANGLNMMHARMLWVSLDGKDDHSLVKRESFFFLAPRLANVTTTAVIHNNS